MNISLEKFSISDFRKIEDYSINIDERWCSITGTNSSGKTSIINALTYLSYNISPEAPDIRSKPSFYPEEFDENINFSVFCELKLYKNLREILNDERFKENLISNYVAELENYQREIEDSEEKQGLRDRIKKIEEIIKTLRSKEDFISFLEEGYRKTIDEEIKRFPDYEPYQIYYKEDGSIKTFEELLDEIKNIRIFYRLYIYDAPTYRFGFCDNDDNYIINMNVFFHVLRNCGVIDHEMTFAFAFGSTFLKGIIYDRTIETGEQIPKPKSYLLRDGSNFEEFILYFISKYPDSVKKIQESFNDIFRQEIEFNIRPSESNLPIEIKIGANDWTLLNRLSDGMYRVLRLLFQLEDSIGNVLLIDEVELHLHPGACKTLREKIKEKKDSTQIITTTHSPLFLDTMYVDEIVLNRIENEKLVGNKVTANDVDLALSELGSSGLNSLLYDVVIWVEGPSDKIYFQRFLELILRDKGKYNLLVNIGVLAYGGKTKSTLHDLDLSSVKKINRKSVFIMDSDRSSSSDPFNSDDLTFQASCTAENLICHILNFRCTENYIPKCILESYYGLSSGFLTFSKYDNVLSELYRLSVRRTEKKKVEFAKQIVPHISIMDLKSVSDLYSELKSIVDSIIILLEN